MTNEKPITISQLKGESTETTQETVQTVSTETLTSEILKVNPDAEPKQKENPIIAGLKSDISAMLEKEKNNAEAYNEMRKQQEIESSIENEETEDEEDKIIEEPEDNNTIPEEKDEEVDDNEEEAISSLEIDNEDFDDIDDDDDEEDEEISYEEEQAKIKEKKQFNQLKSVISDSISPIKNVINLSDFKIAKKPISVSKVLATKKQKTVVDWVLYNSGRSISMSEFEGFEIESLNPRNVNKNKLSTLRDMYKTIYEHVIDENKPKTLEGWLKTVKFSDLDHLYFAVYMASFLGSNKIPYNCTDSECGEVFMSEFEMYDMVKFKTEEIKQKVLKMREQDTTSSGEIEAELVQVSDSYVFAFREPSIYNIIFENSALDESFIEKYKSALGLIAYIDSMYFINKDTMELELIDYKKYPDNLLKTVKSKIKSFSRILKQLNSDQFSNLNSIVNNYITKSDNDDVYYVLPETTCPKCGKKINEQIQLAQNLLFTRHQLVSIANTLTE